MDDNIQYYCFLINKTNDREHLMQPVLAVNKYPDAMAIIKQLIKNPLMINNQNSIGRTALMDACEFTNTISNNLVVNMLIDAKADVNLEDNLGWTALMLSSLHSNTNSNIETVKILIDAGTYE